MTDKTQSPAPIKELDNPFHLDISEKTRYWLTEQAISLIFTTYESGQCIVIAPGIDNKTVIIERRFDRPMSIYQEGKNIWISTLNSIWKMENGLDKGQRFNEMWERLYLPRTSHVTGNVDIHDLCVDYKNDLFAVITKNNCIARITNQKKGNFTPVWTPNFISQMVDEDRCHLNGFCFDEEGLAYASAVGISNENLGWKDKRSDGGVIINTRTNEVIIDGLSMPHTPRLYKNSLWFLEAGRGYLCKYDLETKKLEKTTWLPGFLRGLRFYKTYAFICSSKPRDKIFEGLPLEEEIKKRGAEALCSISIVDLNSNEVIHDIKITGSVKEIYDMVVLEDCKTPLLYGLEQDDMNKMIVIGE